MKRRGFLGFLGGAAVAGPGMVKGAAAQGMEAMNLGQVSGLMGGMSTGGYYSNETDPAPPSSSSALPPTDPRHWVQRQLTDFLGQTAEDLWEQRLRTQVQSLDPDLAVNRSFSLSTKIRIQRDRNFENNRAGHKRSIMRDMKDAMKRWAERDDFH